MTGNSPQALQQPTHGKSHLLVVISLSVAADECAQALAQQLGVPHTMAAQQATGKASQGFDFELHVDEDRTLLQPRSYKSGPIGIDFNSGRNLHRLLHSGGRNQTLARAVGIKRSFNRQQINAWHVLDATSGFCRDSWALAAVGCQVTALERCVWLHEMQLQALQRACNPEDTGRTDTRGSRSADVDHAVQLTAARITPLNSDAISWLRQQTDRLIVSKQSANMTTVDAIYIDPMYPQRKKSAAVKKEMQALHQLLGPDTDSDELLANACEAAQHLATQRIVVKRPGWAEPLPGYAGWQAVTSHSSENTRYDVYLPST